MRRAEFALSAALLLGVSCSDSDSIGSKSVTATSQVEGNIHTTPSHAEATIPLDLTAPFEEGLALYENTYGCPVDVSIVASEIPNDVDSGSGFFSIAISNKPGEILVNTELSGKYASEYSTMITSGEINPTYIGVHEASHACQINNETTFEPVKVPDQDLMFTGVQGLTLITDIPTPDGLDFQMFTNIEEGAAEVLASELMGSDHIAPSYSTYEALTRELMTLGNMNTSELAKYIQTNDIYGFVSQVLGVAEPTSDDLIDIVLLYNSV